MSAAHDRFIHDHQHDCDSEFAELSTPDGTTTRRHTRRYRRGAVAVVGGAAVLAVVLAATPRATSAPRERVVDASRPITVADAYHGVGLMICSGDKRVLIAADAYHGVGVAVCV